MAQETFDQVGSFNYFFVGRIWISKDPILEIHHDGLASMVLDESLALDDLDFVLDDPDLDLVLDDPDFVLDSVWKLSKFDRHFGRRDNDNRRKPVKLLRKCSTSFSGSSTTTAVGTCYWWYYYYYFGPLLSSGREKKIMERNEE